VRYREWKILRNAKQDIMSSSSENNTREATSNNEKGLNTSDFDSTPLNGHASEGPAPTNTLNNMLSTQNVPGMKGDPLGGLKGLWFKVDFLLGVLTTFLVAIAWSTNLLTKPLATAFGGGVALLGMLIAYVNYQRHEKAGRVPVPVVVTRLDERLPNSVLAVLTGRNGHNDAVIRAAINSTDGNRPVVFLYLSGNKPRTTMPRMMEIVDPYLDDPQAKEYFGRAESLALKAKLPTRRFIYLQEEPNIVGQAWQIIHPHDTVVAPDNDAQINEINPDRIRYELTPEGKVTHLLKNWHQNVGKK
jgi:hypothetical protein